MLSGAIMHRVFFWVIGLVLEDVFVSVPTRVWVVWLHLEQGFVQVSLNKVSFIQGYRAILDLTKSYSRLCN